MEIALGRSRELLDVGEQLRLRDLGEDGQWLAGQEGPGVQDGSRGHPQSCFQTHSAWQIRPMDDFTLNVMRGQGGTQSKVVKRCFALLLAPEAVTFSSRWMAIGWCPTSIRRTKCTSRLAQVP